MRVKKAAFVGLFGATMLLTGMQGATSAAATDQMAPGDAVVYEFAPNADNASPRHSLRCRTGHGHTGGWASCRGEGSWRIRSVCRMEPDKYTHWTRQRGGENRVAARDCRFKMNNVIVEMRDR